MGKGGNIQIATGSLLVTNGAGVSSGTGGLGDAGNITINARDKVAIEGFGSSTAMISRVTSNAVGNETVGNAGNIRITTGELLLKDGGGIKAFSGGQRNGGNINLDVVNTTTFDGFSSSGLASSADSFTVGSEADAGNIQLQTGSLFLTNGGQLNTNMLGAGGNAGNITINARDIVSFDGVGKRQFSNASSAVINAVGNGGDIRINAKALLLTNGAGINRTLSITELVNKTPTPVFIETKKGDSLDWKMLANILACGGTQNF